MDSPQDIILIAATTNSRSHFAVYVRNLIIIGSKGPVWSTFVQQPPSEISDLWWGSETQLFYRCNSEDYVIKVPKTTTNISETTNISLYRKLVRPYETRTEGEEIAMAPKKTARQTIVDQAQEHTESTIYFTIVAPKDVVFTSSKAKADMLNRASNIMQGLKEGGVGTRINLAWDPRKANAELLNSVAFRGRIFLTFPNRDDSKWGNDTDSDSGSSDSSSDDNSSERDSSNSSFDGTGSDGNDSGGDGSSCSCCNCLGEGIFVEGTALEVIKTIRDMCGMRKLIHDGSLRVFIWLRLGNRGLRGLFSLRMCQTCNGHDINRKKRTVYHRVEKPDQNNNGRPMLIAKSRQRS
jgi:hypothetical protein